MLKLIALAVVALVFLPAVTLVHTDAIQAFLTHLAATR